MIDRRGLIVGGAALAATGPALAATGPAWAASPSAKARAIDAIALPAGFNGALAYARNGRVEHVRHVGLADLETNRPVTAATAYKWGSATKWLVSTAALRLADQRLVSLDAPILTYLPDFRPDTGARVQLRHLLSNTSGIPDLLSRQLKSEPGLRTSTASPAEIVARFATGDLAFAPGAGWDYAALNWAIVAALLERVTGEPLAPLVTRLVLRPLGMAGAGFTQAGQPPMPALAAAYAGTTPPTRKMAPVPPFLAGSGNAAGTVADAARAAHGIFHGRLLSPAARTALTTVRWPAQDYALGGRVHHIDGAPWGWETGQVQGYRTHIAHRLAASETIIVFNTTDLDQPVIGGWVETIARA